MAARRLKRATSGVDKPGMSTEVETVVQDQATQVCYTIRAPRWLTRREAQVVVFVHRALEREKPAPGSHVEIHAATVRRAVAC